MKTKDKVQKCKTKLKKGDPVIVIAGKHKGKRGKVKEILYKKHRIAVEGINRRKIRRKPTEEFPRGMIVEVEIPIHISNVMYYLEKENRPVRLGFIRKEDGRKVRVARLFDPKTGERRLIEIDG